MLQNNDSEFDRRLRDRLEPDPLRIDRLIRGALAQGARRRFSPALLLRGALSMASVAAMVLLCVHFLGPNPNKPVRSGTESAGAVVLMQAPSGESWILGAGASAVTLPPGMGLVIIEGDSK